MSHPIDAETIYRGGVSIDLGRRYHGMRRMRATYPFGRLKLTDGEASLWVTKLALPRDLPLPVVLTSGSACVFTRYGWPPEVCFKTSSTVHHFWTLHPGRIMEELLAAGFKECS